MGLIGAKFKAEVVIMLNEIDFALFLNGILVTSQATKLIFQ